MITDVDRLYFRWLLEQMESPNDAIGRLGAMLHCNTFTRDIGYDSNRAVEGTRLRLEFLDDYASANIDPRVLNQMQMEDCSWFEMLVALSRQLDYLYDGSVQKRFLELIDNLGLTKVLNSPKDGRYDEIDQDLVDHATTRVDHNLFEANGHGGLFPLNARSYPDQREVDIWGQQAAYFRERLEGVLGWTSIS